MTESTISAVCRHYWGSEEMDATLADTAILRPVEPTDLDAAHGLYTAIRWPHRRDDVAALIELGQGWITAEGDTTLGIGLWWAFGERAARLGSVIVAPGAQGRGLGRRIMDALLADTGDRAVMLAATEAGKPLYEKLGFVVVGGVLQHQGHYVATPTSAAFVRDARETDFDAVVALDAAAFGTERKGALGSLLEAGHGFVVDRGNGIEGYAIDRDFGRGRVVGPIVATTEADAIALFDAAARPGFVRVDITEASPLLEAHLIARGLPRVDTEVTMRRGAWPPATGPARTFALASHALG